MIPRNSWSRSPEDAHGTFAVAGRSPYWSRVCGAGRRAIGCVLRTGVEVCIVDRVAEPQGTVTVALIGSDSGESKMNFELRGSTQRCSRHPPARRVARREVQTETDAPSVRGLVWVAVMGVCLWFENPIACLFELVVMPEIVCFSGETIYWASFDHPRGRVGCLAGIHSAT